MNCDELYGKKRKHINNNRLEYIQVEIPHDIRKAKIE